MRNLDFQAIKDSFIMILESELGGFRQHLGYHRLKFKKNYKIENFTGEFYSDHLENIQTK